MDWPGDSNASDIFNSDIRWIDQLHRSRHQAEKGTPWWHNSALLLLWDLVSTTRTTALSSLRIGNLARYCIVYGKNPAWVNIFRNNADKAEQYEISIQDIELKWVETVSIRWGQHLERNVHDSCHEALGPITLVSKFLGRTKEYQEQKSHNFIRRQKCYWQIFHD